MDARMTPALAAMLLLASCSRAKKEAEPVVPVQVTQARLDSIQQIVSAQGVLYPRTQSGVTPKISAPVRTFHVNRGQHVRKGQLLAILENHDLAAAVAENRGAYEQAEAAYKNATGATVPEQVTKAQQDAEAARQAVEAARKVYESRQELLREGAIARKQVDEAQVAYAQARSQYEITQEHLRAVQNVSRHQDIRSAEGQLQAAKGKYEGAAAQLAYSEIRSPLDGVVADRSLYPGEMASAGTPLLTVMDISRVIARANVPAADAALLKVGVAASIIQADAGIEAPGKVTVVSPAVDPNTTTVQVWVEAANPGERLRPGVTVRINMVAQTFPEAIVIPASALLPSHQGGALVMVVGTDSVAHERKLEIGVKQQDKVQVLKGLRPGERVITVGGLGLEDGAKVRLEAGEKKE